MRQGGCPMKSSMEACGDAVSACFRNTKVLISEGKRIVRCWVEYHLHKDLQFTKWNMEHGTQHMGWLSDWVKYHRRNFIMVVVGFPTLCVSPCLLTNGSWYTDLNKSSFYPHLPLLASVFCYKSRPRQLSQPSLWFEQWGEREELGSLLSAYLLLI